MDLSVLFKRAGKVAADNSPAILTAIGVTGTLTTAYLAAKGAFKSVDILRETEETKRSEFFGDQTDVEGEIVEVEFKGLTFQDKFEATWKLYAPAAASAALTVVAIICSNRISDRRTATIASAYSVVEKSYSEYRTKNLEKIGKKKEEEVRAAVAEDRLNANPVDRTTIVLTGKGTTRCYDLWNDRYFDSDIELIRKAVNDFNAEVINSTYASLTDLYHLLGLNRTSESDHLGWDTDKLLEIEYTGHLDKMGQPCLAIDFKTKPNPRYSSMY